MTLAENWILEERAEQLAIVHLTRRNDLIVTPAIEDSGIDLMVTIARAGVRTGRIFGVQAQGYASLPVMTNGSFNLYTLNTPSAHEPTLTELPFPLCLFVFAMDTDLGYYRWLLEPITTAGLSPTLRVNIESHFMQLTQAALDQLVLQVNTWYDAKRR